MDDDLLAKNIWVHDDFDQMSWHDNKIYGIAFNADSFELSLDIDYICKWVKKADSFMFWVAPATFVFRNVYDLNMSADSLDLTISDIIRERPMKPNNAPHIIDQLEYHWIIETTQGEITFKSVGFTQHLRENPVLIKRQHLTLDERGGISFAN